MWGTDVWGGFLWGGSPEVPLLSPLGLIVLAACLLTAGAIGLRRRGARWLPAALGVVALAVPLVAYANTISIPNVFSNGTTADANEVNANFSIIVNESNAQDGRLGTLEANEITDVNAGTGLVGGGSSGAVTLDVDTTAIQQRVTGSCAPGSSIRTIDSTGTVVCEVDSLGTGDISGVTAGSGLSGGGTSGDVSLSIGTGAVNATHLAADSVGASQVADGSLQDGDLGTSTTGSGTATVQTNIRRMFIDDAGDANEARVVLSCNGEIQGGTADVTVYVDDVLLDTYTCPGGGARAWTYVSLPFPIGSGSGVDVRYQLAAPGRFYWRDVSLVPSKVSPDVIVKGTTIEVVGPGPDLQAIINGIIDETVDKPYLVKLGPGEYQLPDVLTMAEFINIMGSGQGVTILKGPTNGNIAVYGASNAALTDLSVESEAFGTSAWAISNDNASPRIERVTAIASGPSTNSNHGVYNGGTSSPTLTNVTATGTGGYANYGVFNDGTSSPTLTNVTATGAGGSFNFGVRNLNTSSPILTNVTAKGVGGTFAGGANYGVHNGDESSPILTNVSATGKGPGSNYGVYSSTNTVTLKVYSSVLEGSTAALRFGGNTAARIVNSAIIGTVSNNPSGVNCMGVYRADSTTASPVGC